MDNVNTIRNRITNKNKHSRLFVLCMSVMLMVCGVLGVLIYAKGNSNAEIFGFKIATINEKINAWVGGIFKTSTGEDETVSNPINSYTYLGNNYYKTDDNAVNTIYKGTINNITKQENDKYYVLISYDNGVTAQYFDLVDILVKNNDTLTSNQIIGGYEEKFKALFMRGNEVIKYDEIFNRN